MQSVTFQSEEQVQLKRKVPSSKDQKTIEKMMDMIKSDKQLVDEVHSNVLARALQRAHAASGLFILILSVRYTKAIISEYSFALVVGVAPECPLCISTLNKG